MRKLAKYFASGLLFLIPVAATVYVVYGIFSAIDGGVRALLGDQLDWWFTGLGVVISLAVVTLVGVLTSLFIMRPIVQLVERVLGGLPLIRLLYSSIKDLIGAFVGEKKKFDQPVLVSVIKGGSAKALGFVTRRSLDFLGLKDEVAVYFPQSYNFAGNVLIVGADQVQLVDADSSEVMAFIVSGGVSGGGGSQEGEAEK